MKMSGLITLLDGFPGAGKSSFGAGMPGPRAVLDTDNDGWRWLREHAQTYVSSRNITEAKGTLRKWADAPISEVQSIVVDTHSHFWQSTVTQVLDDKDRNPRTDMHKTWGAAKIAVRRSTHDAYLRAKRAGKHVLLVAHCKEDTRREEDQKTGKTKIYKEGLKADSEAFLNDMLDLWIRLFWRPRTNEHWLEVVKCRPQRDFRPMIPLNERIVIPEFESHLMYGRLLEKIGRAPEALSQEDGDAIDAATEAAMKGEK
jgi:hypothetical protein